MCGKNISIYGVHIPRKFIESMHFYSCDSAPLKTPGNLICMFPSENGMGGGNFDFLYQNSRRKFVDELEQ